MGIDYEEKAFYDILKAVAKKYEFEYPDDKMIELSKRIKLIVDDKAKYTDWSTRDDIKANLQVDLILLLDEFDSVSYTHLDVYKRQENDIIGRIYEYFLSKFALAEGKGKGEFYTPKCIVNLIAEIIEPYDEMCIRDRIYEEGQSDKLTQLLFCDLSTPKNDGTFNVYEDIRAKLIQSGVPEEEIAFIHDADTEAKKKDLFAKVRTGQVRVLLGSTRCV